MTRWLVTLALLLICAGPASAVPMHADYLVLTYCGLGESLYACLDVGVPFLLDVQVSADPAPIHLIERPDAVALGLPLGLALDYYGLLSGTLYSTDWLFWGPWGWNEGVPLAAITLAPPITWAVADAAPVAETPEPRTLFLVGSGLLLAASVWRWRRERG